MIVKRSTIIIKIFKITVSLREFESKTYKIRFIEKMVENAQSHHEAITATMKIACFGGTLTFSYLRP